MTPGAARRIAAVFAHPDDDTYGLGGSLAVHADDGLEVTVVLATSGDAGRIADPSLATRETLGRVREAEDVASWRALGFEPDVRFLRHPDGRLPEVPRDELVREIAAVLRSAQPDVVVTFGPDGITGHADHVTIGEAATEAFHRARGSGGDGFGSLLYTAIPVSALDRLNEGLRERGLEPIDSTQPFMPRGVPDEEIGVRVDCSPAYERKLEALRCHRTQAEMEDVPFDLWPDLLGTESFVVAWPERRPADPVATDLLAIPAAS
jgi:LmbE family N-acetylglucosaminyl deacetylase